KEICREVCSTTTMRRLEEELLELERAVRLGDPDSPALTDYILSFGERLSKMIMREVLEAQGLKVFGVDSRDVIVTNERHGDASIDYELTRPRVEKMYRAAIESEAIPILEGFIGSTPHGRVTTLGRGGSDYTATAIASILEADAELVTDVDGVMSADPRLVPTARVVDSLSYVEAFEASLNGVKRMNPKALEPPIKVSPIEIRVRSWESKGTTISNRSLRYGFKIVALPSANRPLIALVGELGDKTKEVLQVLEVIKEAGADVESLELPLGRPVLKIQIAKKDVNLILRRLHDELLGGRR
ncbi:MAG: hypothetical protein QXY09_03100, partial [Acidilobaceae archaeon]